MITNAIGYLSLYSIYILHKYITILANITKILKPISHLYNTIFHFIKILFVNFIIITIIVFYIICSIIDTHNLCLNIYNKSK